MPETTLVYAYLVYLGVCARAICVSDLRIVLLAPLSLSLSLTHHLAFCHPVVSHCVFLLSLKGAQRPTSLYYCINVTGMSQPVRYSEETALAQDFLEGLSLPTSKVTDDGPVSLP